MAIVAGLTRGRVDLRFLRRTVEAAPTSRTFLYEREGGQRRGKLVSSGFSERGEVPSLLSVVALDVDVQITGSVRNKSVCERERSESASLAAEQNGRKPGGGLRFLLSDESYFVFASRGLTKVGSGVRRSSSFVPSSKDPSSHVFDPCEGDRPVVDGVGEVLTPVRASVSDGLPRDSSEHIHIEATQGA